MPRQVEDFPTALVFDLGGVLIDWNPRHLYRQLLGDDTEMERFLAEVCTPEWNRAQDAGRRWADGVAVLTSQFPESRDLIEAYDRRWDEMVRGEVPGVVPILDELRASDVRLLALTNWSTEKFVRTKPRFPFLDWFEGIVVSGEIGLVKPDPMVYRYCVSLFGLEPSTTVFIDDSEQNVAAAVSEGLIGVRFIDAPSLRRDLRALGVRMGAPAG